MLFTLFVVEYKVGDWCITALSPINQNLLHYKVHLSSLEQMIQSSQIRQLLVTILQD